jgi:ABC-type transport system substrate-binding protein
MAYGFARLILFFSVILVVGCLPKNKKLGSSITYNISGEPTTLSPLSASDGYSTAVHSYIFESLLDRDIDTFEWKPALATEWTISKDKRVFKM